MSDTPPRWLTSSGLVWSSVPEQHDRYNEAKSDCSALPQVIADKAQTLKNHADDIVSLTSALSEKPKDEVLKLRYDDKKKAHDKLSSDIQNHQRRIARAQGTLDHFEHHSIEQAWAKLFREELPTTEPLDSWNDGNSQSYFLYLNDRVVTRGKYDGILISDNDQPII
jgi:gas vesicle protein